MDTKLAIGAAALLVTGCNQTPEGCDDLESQPEADPGDTGWQDYCDYLYEVCVCDNGKDCEWICNG